MGGQECCHAWFFQASQACPSRLPSEEETLLLGYQGGAHMDQDSSPEHTEPDDMHHIGKSLPASLCRTGQLCLGCLTPWSLCSQSHSRLIWRNSLLFAPKAFFNPPVDKNTAFLASSSSLPGCLHPHVHPLPHHQRAYIHFLGAAQAEGEESLGNLAGAPDIG